MSDRRQHRGPHPADEALFAPSALPALRLAVADLSWLLGRGYAAPGALKLVGDRHALRERQRLAALRSACSDEARAARGGHRVVDDGLLGRRVAIDGFNALITIEAALSGGVLLRGRDGALRDLASVHGSYRSVSETERAIALLGERLAAAGAGPVRLFLDRPVSNSGRLRALIEATAAARGWRWEVALVDAPDRALLEDGEAIVASSDSWVLDRAAAWIDLPALVIARAVSNAWIVDLGDSR